ncbi:CD99 molecule isoform X2 [Pygocentrus nattereri]|uniref:CD99 molecule isoform X2 n=1 Tax=Pygocentrus nattereri TaxID=42514 RepID=UPI0008142679|nr:CD99 molecule isoform X2 [Pygocentrus nattereri]
MTSYLWILVLASLAGSRAQDLNLFDALEPEPVPTKPAQKPPKSGGDDLNLFDALEPEPVPTKPAQKPPKSGGDGDFNILDAFDVDPKKPAGDPKKPVAPPKHGGDALSDSDLGDVANNDYKPDPSRKGSGDPGRAADSSYDSSGGDGEAQDLDQQWLKLLKLLGDNIPEGLHAWIANSKQVVMSLLERVLELLELAEKKNQS